MSLFSELRRGAVGIVGRVGLRAAADDDDGAGTGAETCRDCWGRRGAYTGVDVDIWGNCSGGIVMGDFDRLRDEPPRVRLRERPRIRVEMAPKKEASVGDVGERGPRECVEVGDSVSGEAKPDECDFCDKFVPVRIGGGGWNRSLS